jgi:hypothetical protein
MKPYMIKGSKTFIKHCNQCFECLFCYFLDKIWNNCQNDNSSYWLVKMLIDPLIKKTPFNKKCIQNDLSQMRLSSSWIKKQNYQMRSFWLIFPVKTIMIFCNSKSARWRCLVDLYISTMCLEKVVSPCFGVEVTFIKLRIVSKGLLKSVRWRCLVDLYISTMCLESVVSPCFGTWVALTNLVFYFNALNDENMWFVEGNFVLGSPCYLCFNNLKWLNPKVVTFLYF